ncbi:MAG: hypothetical protein NZ518_03040 [Dehalococcoidia bacterium]|nr:hypothetical protein [Dehalococcoidia bacterium]
MAEIYDYLEDQLRDIEADIKRAARRADALHRAINPVSEFGNQVRVETFSVTQSLEAALRQIEETRQRLRVERAKKR